MWNKIKQCLVQLLFPLRCPVCDNIVVPYGEKICMECMHKLRLLTPPWCMRCGKKLLQEQEYCRDCTKTVHSYTAGRALYEYQSVTASVYRFKYGDRQEYADYFGEEVVKYLGDFIDGTHAEGIIPVPLHRKRENDRGYNQAKLLAEAIGKRKGIPVYDRVLVRVKNTAPLKQQNPKERQNNLKRAFNVRQNDVKLKRVIVVDDIYTTGSTIDEISRVLKAHGVQEVYFVALACGEGI